MAKRLHLIYEQQIPNILQFGLQLNQIFYEEALESAASPVQSLTRLYRDSWQGNSVVFTPLTWILCFFVSEVFSVRLLRRSDGLLQCGLHAQVSRVVCAQRRLFLPNRKLLHLLSQAQSKS